MQRILKKIILWMKTIHYPNTLRSHLVTIVLMSPFTPKSTTKLRSGVNFSSDAARRFAGFLRCDSRTIMKSFLKKKSLANSQETCIKIARSFLRSRERFFEKRFHYCTTIAPQKSCESQSCV